MPRTPINGAEIYYETRGAGPVLLFHHGYTGSHDAWEEVVPAFADRFRCIVMDTRGAGDSSHPPSGHTISGYADDVIGLMDHLGVPSFTFVGHSMGGAVGYELGLRHAGRLDRLVFVAPAPADGIRSLPGVEEQREYRRALRAAGDRETLVREAIALAARPNPPYLQRSVDRALSVSEAHFEESWQSLMELDLGARLKEITVPALMMAGAADGLLHANLADFRRLGNATLHVFSRVAHGMEYEAPAEFNAVLADFLEHGVVTARTLLAGLGDRSPAPAAR